MRCWSTSFVQIKPFSSCPVNLLICFFFNIEAENSVDLLNIFILNNADSVIVSRGKPKSTKSATREEIRSPVSSHKPSMLGGSMYVY